MPRGRTWSEIKAGELLRLANAIGDKSCAEHAVAGTEFEDSPTGLNTAAHFVHEPAVVSHDGVDETQFATTAHRSGIASGQRVEEFRLDSALHGEAF